MQPISTPATVQADEAIVAGESRIASLAQRAADMRVKLAGAEKKASDEVLSGSEPRIGYAVRYRGELMAVEGALKSAQAALPALQRERAQVEVSELRRLASDRLSEAEEIERQARKHLVKLSELEGISYTISVLSSQRSATGWYAAPQFLEGGNIEPAEFLGLHETLRDVAGTVLEPKSRILRAEAADLQGAARDAERNLAAADVIEPEMTVFRGMKMPNR